MNALRRGARNAFRNAMRSVGVVVILGVAIALSISMLIARGAERSLVVPFCNLIDILASDSKAR